MARPAHVYLMEIEGGAVKVGRAINPLKRLYEVQTSCPVKIRLVYASDKHSSPEAVEKAAHYLLREKRQHGEWFGVSVEQARAAIEEAVRMVDRDGGFSVVPPRQRVNSSGELVGMSRDQFGRALDRNRLSIKDFARMAVGNVSTVYRWLEGNRPVPGWCTSWLWMYERIPAKLRAGLTNYPQEAE